jgi:hypothetical protein
LSCRSITAAISIIIIIIIIIIVVATTGVGSRRVRERSGFVPLIFIALYFNLNKRKENTRLKMR